MRSIRAYMTSLLLLLLAQVAWGQSTETVALSGADVLKATHLYPNPAIEFLHVKFEQPVAREVSLELHSIIGNVLEVEQEIVDDYEVRVRVKDLPSGYYLLDVKKPGVNHVAFKFLKR